jgi:hypothetical protein
MSIPTTQECVDSAVAALESNLGQDVPLYSKSFLRALAVVLGMNNAQLYRFGVKRSKMVLALTASGDDLTNLGREYGIIRKPAVKALLEATWGTNNPVTLSKTTTWKSEDNGMYYFLLQDYTFATDGVFDIQVRAEFAGPDGELQNGSFITTDSAPAASGPSPNATISDIVEKGANEETDEELRIRILDEIQTVGGGSNLADYRTWAQRTPNVLRADPYTGKAPAVSGDPWDDSIPGERTVFIEATTSYDPDGIADAALLSLATDYINYDQETGERQPCLGSTDDTLYVESIYRTEVTFNVYGLVVDSASFLNCQADITAAIDTFVRSMHPFILGLDAEVFRNDTLTITSVSRVVQRVVQAYGGSVGLVEFIISGGSAGVSYRMNPGERLKAVVQYVS